MNMNKHFFFHRSSEKNLVPPFSPSKHEDDTMHALSIGDEWLNCLTHGLGLLLSLFAAFFLIYPTFEIGDSWRLINFAIYGGSLILLYAASTCYHGFKKPKLKRFFRVLDHCAIYLLIAGTYTPFTLLLLEGSWGRLLFTIVWSLAIIGIVLKILLRHRYKMLFTFFYLAMGWLIVAALEPLLESFHPSGLYWLLAGGLCYTIGVVFFALDRRRFYHAIWHLFVMGGSACHYFAILFYL